MFRNLLATTAIATLVSTGAFAQTTAPTTQAPLAPAEDTAPRVKAAEGYLASNMIGETVYNGAGDDAANIGEVNDLVLGANGQVEAVVIGVGGFLGIGQKDVAIEYDLVKWNERDGDEFLVVETTADALKAQAAFERAAYEPMPAGSDVAETKPATKEDLANAPVADDTASDTAMTDAATPAAPAADPAAPAADTTAAAPAPADNMAANDTAQAPAATDPAGAESTAAIDRSTLKPLDTAQIKTEEFVGTTVYGANDENVGEIGDVVMQGDAVDAVIIDVGGFLGIGEKQVAVGLDNLAFLTDEDGDRYLYTEWTKEQLEAQPAYDAGQYADRRDEMRMVVPNG